MHYFVRLFNSPCDGFKRIPFFNKNLNDTKDIDVIIPPDYDRKLGKIRTILKVQYHSDIDVHQDYTVIGNQVNVAARLEPHATSGQILISQRTYSRVKDIVQAESVGKIRVKGIHCPVITFNVLTG